jgi:hypothetical protein
LPIVGETPEDAVGKFVDHINDVLSRTITDRRVQALRVPSKRLAYVSFPRRNGSPTAARLDTRFGSMRFLFGQVLGTDPVDGHFQLYTLSYGYKLTMADDRQPFVRWEYVKPKGLGDLKCRHHLQGPIELTMGRSTAALDGFHLPTGWVTFEEVVRFCIVDLKATSRTKKWNDVLLESYRKFKEEFAPLGQV